MRTSSCFSFIVLFVILFSSCQKNEPLPIVFTQNAMTIDYKVLIGSPLTSEQKKEVQEIINFTFNEIDTFFNKWNPQSEISLLNALNAKQTHILSPSLYQFFLRIDPLVKISEGRFDPTIESLQQVWKEKLSQGIEPSQLEIATVQATVGWAKIHFNNGIFYKDHSGTKLDFGGVVKGHCVDLLIDRLQKAGYHHLYVEWGGEIRTLGHHPKKRPWNVYIRGLEDTNPAHAIAYLSLENQALATSGDYYQYWIVKTPTGEQKTYTHIINPQTFRPLTIHQGSIASATIMADDCLTADALAKVLMFFNSPEDADVWIKKTQKEIPHFSAWIYER